MARNTPSCHIDLTKIMRLDIRIPFISFTTVLYKRCRWKYTQFLVVITRYVLWNGFTTYIWISLPNGKLKNHENYLHLYLTDPILHLLTDIQTWTSGRLSTYAFKLTQIITHHWKRNVKIWQMTHILISWLWGQTGMVPIYIWSQKSSKSKSNARHC